MARLKGAVVINPFTMQPMSRTPGGSKWAIAENDAPLTQGPNRGVTVVPKKSLPRSQVGSVHYPSYEDVSPRTIDGPTSHYELYPGIHKFNAVPAQNVRSLRQESWEADELRVADYSSSHRNQPGVSQRSRYSVSPLEFSSFPEDRPEPVIAPRKWPTPDKSPVPPPQSAQTAWPRFSPARGKDVQKARAAPGKEGKVSLRRLYRAGSVSDATKIFRAVKHYRIRKKNEKQRQRQQLQFAQPQTILHPNEAYQRPLPKLPRDLDRLYDLTSLTDSTSRNSQWKGKGIQRSSGATGVSTSSAELPFTASASVRGDLSPRLQERFVETAKPLPSVPMLNPAPKPRRLDKALPAPPPPPLPPGKSLVSNDFHVPYPRVYEGEYATLGDVQTQKPNYSEKKKKSSVSAWLGRRRSKRSEELVDVFDTDQVKRKQQSIKAKISQPQPMMATDSRTVNIAKESGGVGGPAAAISLPLSNGLSLRPRAQKEKIAMKINPPRPDRSTQSSIHEAPYPSYPMMDPYAQTQSQGQAHQQPNRSPRAGSLYPAPLFSARSSERSGNRYG